MRATVAIVLAFVAISTFPPVQPAMAQGTQAVVQPTTKPVDCRAEAQSKGLRGQAVRDAVAVCVLELRLKCLKEAIEKKVVGKERRAFMTTCAGRPGKGVKSED